jgi:hypothetical protein
MCRLVQIGQKRSDHRIIYRRTNTANDKFDNEEALSIPQTSHLQKIGKHKKEIPRQKSRRPFFNLVS